MHLRTFRHEARDDYLEAILQIQQEKGYCRAVNVAEELGVTKPSVSVEIGKLVEGGFITLDADKLIHFTPGGRELAELTYAKHCYFRALLMDVGVEEDTAEKEACALEHAISGETFRKIQAKYPMK